ncbi:MAG: hypothetical protein JSW27_20580 [Phycisphaerales bacterium]|nr:MAG: hypothetical protein JSW27_20580 [Phycisphaerales bacterium]
MIHFSCMYCGRKIRAKATLIGRKAPCPACGHRLLIPKPSAPCEETTAPDAPAAIPNQAHLWEGKSNKEIAKLLLRDRPLMPEQQERAAVKQAISPLLPRYDELTLFALSVTFLLLLAINPEMQRALPRVALFLRDGRISLLVGVAAVGMVFSLFGIFFPFPKPELVKWPMLTFAVVVTGGTGLYTGYITFTTTRGWLIVFPAWNIINGVLLLALFSQGLLDPNCILDRRAKFWQVVLTLVCVGVLLAVCEYAFELHWAITYSVCVGYTMSLHHGITDIFGSGDGEDR